MRRFFEFHAGLIRLCLQKQSLGREGRCGKFCNKCLCCENGLRPGFQRIPTPDYIDRRLLGGFVRRKTPHHIFHNECGLVVTIHLHIGFGQSKSQRGIKALKFPKGVEFAGGILDLPGEPLAFISIGREGFHAVSERCDSFLLMDDDFLKRPDRLQAKYGIPQFALFQKAVTHF